jgi:hypothetical protein
VIDKVKDQEGGLLLEKAPLAGGRTSGSGIINFDSDLLMAHWEEIRLQDARLAEVWGERLVRIIFRMDRPPLQGRIVFRIR